MTGGAGTGNAGPPGTAVRRPRVPVPPQTLADIPVLAWRSLSPGERAAAALAVRGFANREIAAALSVTTRTVELRLSGVYRKLRIRGRDDLRALVQGTEDD
ncbi:hypothetical protein B7767_31115 [Streptomyces sp. 13-12-16]|nr:hypothetical protein B7767_31115 [Streptomyces sp. 13-12-16]